MTIQAAAAQAVADAVGQIAFGPESTFENLSIVALLGDQDRDADYLIPSSSVRAIADVV